VSETAVTSPTDAWMDSPDARWLAGGICLPRLAAVNGELVERALPWLTAVLSELGAMPPPGFVIDLALLLEGKPLETTGALPVEHATLRAAIGRYEDRVLGRVAADRRLQAVRDAHAGLPAALRPLAVGVLAASIARHGAAETTSPSIGAGILRRLSRKHPDEVIAAGFDAWRSHPDVLDRLAAGYASLAEGARTARSLLTEADVFTLENLAVLGEMGQRVAIAQVVDAADALRRSWPRRVKVARQARGPAPTSLEDESAYPAGGFSSVANQGAFENLVTSELVYMDTEAERARGVDLFDVRYAEGELLFYTRDEALIVRPRRLIAFVLHPSLEGARLKDPGVTWQRVVLMLGWILASLRCLERWLGAAELRFWCVIEREDSRVPKLAHEEELLRLLLTEWRDKGMAEVTTASRSEWSARLGVEASRADVRAVVLTLDEDDVTIDDDRVMLVPFVGRARDWRTWCADGLEVLQRLV
jgi:hypothetical protein